MATSRSVTTRLELSPQGLWGSRQAKPQGAARIRGRPELYRQRLCLMNARLSVRRFDSLACRPIDDNATHDQNRACPWLCRVPGMPLIFWQVRTSSSLAAKNSRPLSAASSGPVSSPRTSAALSSARPRQEGLASRAHPHRPHKRRGPRQPSCSRMPSCRAQSIIGITKHRSEPAKNVRRGPLLTLPLFPGNQIDVPKLQGEGTVRLLVRKCMRRFVHIDCAEDEKVPRPWDLGSHVVHRFRHLQFGSYPPSNSFAERKQRNSARHARGTFVQARKNGLSDVRGLREQVERARRLVCWAWVSVALINPM